MLRVVAAGVGDLMRMLQARSRFPLPAARYGWLLAQVGLSNSFAVYVASPPACGAPLAIAGIAPIDGGAAGEIWFGVTGKVSGPELVAMVRMARKVLDVVASDYPLGMFALVRIGHRPGERLAAAVGLKPTGVVFQGCAEWRWGNGVCVQDLPRA